MPGSRLGLFDPPRSGDKCACSLSSPLPLPLSVSPSLIDTNETKTKTKVANLGEYQQNNYYCHAPFPGALDSLAYKAPHGSELLGIQIITRNGDRAPCG